MGSTSDQAAPMVRALLDFEGAPCVDHKIQNALKHASKGDLIQRVEKKCRGIVAHFRRSNKVMMWAPKIVVIVVIYLY